MSVESIVREWVRRAWNEKDLSVIDDLWEPGSVAQGAPVSGAIAGKEEIRDLFAAQHEAFPGMQAHIRDLVISGDRAAMYMEASGIHRAKLWGAPATGQVVRLEVCALFIVRDGKIHGGTQILNFLSLSRQLWGK